MWNIHSFISSFLYFPNRRFYDEDSSTQLIEEFFGQIYLLFELTEEQTFWYPNLSIVSVDDNN